VDGLDADELERLADRLEAIEKEEIAAHVEVLPEA
jgi:hypothetical protein